MLTRSRKHLTNSQQLNRNMDYHNAYRGVHRGSRYHFSMYRFSPFDPGFDRNLKEMRVDNEYPEFIQSRQQKDQKYQLFKQWKQQENTNNHSLNHNQSTMQQV